MSLPIRTKLAFGMGGAGYIATVIGFNSFNMLFYQNALGLSGTLAGLAVAVALVLDAVSNPLVGAISDRWHSRLGRRHPFLYFAALPTGLGFFAVYNPPAALHGMALFAWFVMSAALLKICVTFFYIPHVALGAELSPDYRERSVVMGYNAIFQVLGGASTYFLAWSYLGSHAGGTANHASYGKIGLGVALFAAAMFVSAAFFTRDRIPHLVEAVADAPRFALRTVVEDGAACLRNHNYRTLLLGLLVLNLTIGIRETIDPYVTLFFWELPEAKIRYFGFGSPPGFVIAFLVTPWLNARFGKRATMMFAVCVLAISVVLPVGLRLLGLMPGNQSPSLFSLLMLAVMLIYGTFATLDITIMSALADVVDEHELTSGRRQEGTFYAVRNFFAKLVLAFAHVLAGLALDLIHFKTGAKPGSVDPEVVHNLGLLAGPMACAPAIFGVFCYAGYRIDKRRHDEIRLELAARASARQAAAA